MSLCSKKKKKIVHAVSCACIMLRSFQLDLSTQEVERRLLELPYLFSSSNFKRASVIRCEPIPLSSIWWFFLPASLSSLSWCPFQGNFCCFFHWASSVYNQAIVIYSFKPFTSWAFCPFSR